LALISPRISGIPERSGIFPGKAMKTQCLQRHRLISGKFRKTAGPVGYFEAGIANSAGFAIFLSLFRR
jgi:hypothetical protein